jgi:hypothetical protein
VGRIDWRILCIAHALSYDDIRGKALGVLQHAPSMEGTTCPIDQDHVHDIVHGKTGHFKYIPNGKRLQQPEMSPNTLELLDSRELTPQVVPVSRRDCRCCSTMA